MSIPRTPSTSNYSTLETQERNDHTTLANGTPPTPAPELPDPSTGNEFEVEKRNEVHPDQTGTELTKEDDNESTTEDKSKDDEDWDADKKEKLINFLKSGKENMNDEK